MTCLLTFLFQMDSINVKDFLSKDKEIEIIILVFAGLIVPMLLWLARSPNKLISLISKIKQKENKSIWKIEISSKNIKPGVHLNISDYKEIFLERESFKIVKQKFLYQKRNLILTGRSGLGKTRSIFEIISKSKTKFVILIPFLSRPESYEFKSAFKQRKRVILIIDDLQKYNTDDINYYLENLIANSKGVQLLCTCRIEHVESIYSSFQIPNIERYELSEWTESEGKSLADLLNVSFIKNTFDYTAASIIYKLDKLKERYKQLNINQIAILECIKLLKILGLDCNSGSIKEAVSNIYELDKKYFSYYNWRTEINNIKKIGFFNISSSGEIIINDIYLNELIEIDFYSAFNRYFNFLKKSENSGSIFYCGLSLEKRNDIKNAEKCYKAAIELFPSYASSYYKLASLYLSKSGIYKKALENNSALKSILLAIDYFLKAIKFKVNDYSYYLSLGYAYTKAASIFDNLLDKSNETKNLEDAIQSLNKAIELNPKSSSSYRMRGFCHFELANYERALSDYKIALQLNPNSYQTYFLLGILHNHCKRDDNALENYRCCIELKKDFFHAYNDIGHILHKSLDNHNLNYQEKKFISSEACKNYLFAIWYSRGKHFVAYSNLGHLYIDIEEFEKAIKVQTIVIKKSSNYSEAYRSRAYCFNKIRNFKEAESDLLKSIELDSTSESAILSLAFCYQGMGAEKQIQNKRLEAEKSFNKAIQYYDKLSSSKNKNRQLSANVGKAITLYKMGEQEKGFEIFKNIFSVNTENDKVFYSIAAFLVYDKNDEQLLSFLLLVLELVKEKKLTNISKNIMNICTLHIQRFSKNKILDSDLHELLELLKDIYPQNYYVQKTLGIYNLNKGMVEEDFETKMILLTEAENNLDEGRRMAPSNPVFLKYLCIVNAEKCLAFFQQFNKTKNSEDLVKYQDSLNITNKMFEDSKKRFFDYPELRVENSIFLYSLGFSKEGKENEEEAINLFKEQCKKNIKTESQTIEELKKLNNFKLKLYAVEE